LGEGRAAVGNEIELARRLIEGDESARESFIETFQKKVFQYSYLSCGQREDAEEVAQETLLKVWEHFDELREPEHVKTWVFQIARNVCLTRRRRSTYAPCEELSIEKVPTEWQGGLADKGDLPEDVTYQHELRKLLARAIHGLPEKYRSVVVMRDLEEMSIEETAGILGVNEGVVKTRLKRARGLMRKKLEGKGFLSLSGAE
jgi:RNA polymerase sigma-70 factor (ECF subfamily)